MEYQVNISYRFYADNVKEAEKKAKLYVRHNLDIRAMQGVILSPMEVAQRCSDFRNAEKEHFVGFYLDTQHKVLCREIISIGTLDTSIVHPRECFKTAVRESRCSGIIFVHNHPSGSLEPSANDIAVTQRLKDVGKLLGIDVLDHIIVTAERHMSFKEKRLI
jgi:DNA repair protein RadC